ncbi:MAG TPA: PAS domain-containing protein, partial [Flavobacteriaceae bacterium]|nr:PAS domain-containing protein [Flavobacteriaceae bacterium]
MVPPKPTYEELEQRVKELEKNSLEQKYVEKTLKFERDKLKALIDGLAKTNIGVDIVSTDYKIIQQNQTLIDQFGDIAGKKCYKEYMALEEPCSSCPMVKALKNKRLEKAEMRSADGRDYEILSAPLTDPDGVVDKAIEVVLDITDRKQIEKALKKNKAILKAVFDSLPFDVFALDSNNRYFLQNSICKKNWGDFIGKCPEDLPVNKETLNLWMNNNRKAFGGETVADEVEYQSLEGKKYCYYNIIAPIRDEENISGILGVLVDISNLKQAEEALRESKSKLNTMLASIGDHMSMMDKDLNILWANEIAEKIFGNDIIGKKCYEVYHKRKEPCEPYPCITLRAFQNGTIHEHDTQVVGEDKNTIFFHCTANVALRDKEGKPISVLEISRDITEKVRAEKALHKAKNELERRVSERTRDLEIKTKNLEETNIAMEVLLKKRDEDKKDIEDNVLTNVKELIAPFFKKIKKTELDDQQKTFLSIIESNINEIISPFTRKMSLKYLNLTPTEIRIANLIRHGSPTKEIAELLNLSPRTVETHRKNIR